MSRMGEALAIETAHIAHYPNFIRDRKKKTRITFIDSNAREEMDKFKQSFPHLFNVSYSRFIDTENGTETISTPLDTYAPLGKDLIDTEWQFVQGRAESDTVKNLLCKWADDPDALMTVAVCLNLTHTSIATAMYLPDNIFTKEIPVLVQQRITSAIIDNISGEAGTQKKYYKYRNLRPFGMLCECLTLDNTLLEQAKRVNHIYNLTYSHNENRIEPNANLEAHMTDNITDNYRKGWEELKRNKPVVKQWSNIYNACSIPTKLRSAGICPNELKNLTVLDDDKVRIIAEVEHNRWNIEELMLGYRPFNFNENAEFQNLSETAQNEMVKDKKNIYIHYDIREYSQLPEVTKIYDITASRYIPFIVNGTTAYDQNNQII